MIIVMLWGSACRASSIRRCCHQSRCLGSTRDGDNIRIVGPLVGWNVPGPHALVSIPRRQAERRKPRSGDARGALEIWTMLRHMRVPLMRPLPHKPDALCDARLAALMFGGIYAAGVMKWVRRTAGHGLFGTIIGVFGGLLGGWLDTRIGPGAPWSLRSPS